MTVTSSSTCGKRDKNKYNLRLISKPHAYVQTMSKTPVKFQKNRYKTEGEMRTQGLTHYPFTLIVKITEKWLSSTCGKSDKNNLRIIPKAHMHAYIQTMFKSLVKFQRNRHKIVGGVAHTRYSLSIHFYIKNA